MNKNETTVPCRACKGNPSQPHHVFERDGECTWCGGTGWEEEEALRCQNSHQLLVRVGVVQEDYPGHRDELISRF